MATKSNSTPETTAAATKPAAEKAPKEDPGLKRLQEARAKNLDLAIQQIQKEYGEGAILRMGDEHKVDIDAIPTGNLLIDRALGVGGFPRGRIVEVYGPESSGKTTLALTVAAQAQKRGGLAGFIDVEHALDPQYAQPSRGQSRRPPRLPAQLRGGGPPHLRDPRPLQRPRHRRPRFRGRPRHPAGARGGDRRCHRRRPGPPHERRSPEAHLRHRQGPHHRHLHQPDPGEGRRHVRQPETTPGGRALKFYSSVRVDIRRIGSIKQTDGTITGNRTKLKIVKNKVAPPYTEAEFDIMYNEGISAVGSLLDLALDYDIVQKRGSWFSYKGTQVAQGRDAAKIALKEDSKMYGEIETSVRARMDEDAADNNK